MPFDDEERFYDDDEVDVRGNDAVAAHIAPAVLTVTTSHLLGPPTKTPLSAHIYRLLDPMCCGNLSTRNVVSYLLSQLDSGAQTWVSIAEKLENILHHDHDPILLKLFKDECPGLFAAGTDKYVFSGLDGPLIMRPGYDARYHVEESSLDHGEYYDSKVRNPREMD